MNPRSKKYLLLIAVAAILSLAPVSAIRANAAGLTVAPAVIDDHGLPNDILKYSITVTNTDSRIANVFASVYNLTADGQQSFVDSATVDASLAAKSVSFANWISVSRGAMTFQPGETKTIPVTVNVNPYAVAGIYHAVIAFVEGNTRVEAETHLDGAPQTLMDLTVQSNTREELTLTSFASTERFASAFPVNFSYAIKNTGDVASTPSGLVIFYDRLGHELGSVDANPDKIAIAPGETHDFTAKWGSGQGFGQYKAMLDLTYGAAGNKLQDVAFVWVLPWRELLVIFMVLLAIVVVFGLWLYRWYERRHHARLNAIHRILSDRQKQQHHPVLDLRHPHDQSHEDH